MNLGILAVGETLELSGIKLTFTPFTPISSGEVLDLGESGLELGLS